MFSFKEWFHSNEAARWAAYETLPDRLPKTGDIVVLFDEPKTNIVNKNIYKVLKQDGDNIHLYTPYIQPVSTLTINSKSWNDFTPITHLLSSSEKKKDWTKGFVEVWAIGGNKDKWIANREKSKTKPSTIPQSATFSPLQQAMVKQSLMQPVEPGPEDLALQKAKASLFGGEPLQKSKTPDDLARKIRMQWVRD